MSHFFLSAMTAVLFTSSAFAGLLTTTPGAKAIEGIQISQSGTVSIENQQIPVTTIGAGLRSKHVAIINVKVYVAELLSSDASKFVRTDANALDSLEQSRTIALRLTFVRGVDAPTVQTSFAEALKANGTNTSDASIAQFLAAVANGGDAISGKTFVIVTQKQADKSEAVYYEDSNGHSTKILGGEGFSRKLMAIWLGTPADSGVATLKQQLIQGQ